MGKRGIMGILFLLIVASLVGLFVGPKKLAKMEKAIQGDLASAGYSDFAKVDMVGNVARLTGTAPSEAAATDAMNIAKNTKCPFCRDKDKTWHEVDNKLDFDTLPTQSPYTFSGRKNPDGKVSITGFVGSEAAKQSVIKKAESVFGDRLVSKSVTVAHGAPNDNWNQVVGLDMEQLDKLKTGRFEMTDRRNYITGEADSVGIRDGVAAAGPRMPGSFNFSSDISVGAQVKSVDECQVLFNEIKSGKSILFETSKANIKGAASFDLLNKVAAAANRCSSFNIAVEGHTDSRGSDALNQELSQRRANEVLNYLGQNGVNTSRLTARGFGETKPVAPNDTAAGRAQNRRIDFTVTQSK